MSDVGNARRAFPLSDEEQRKRMALHRFLVEAKDAERQKGIAALFPDNDDAPVGPPTPRRAFRLSDPEQRKRVAFHRFLVEAEEAHLQEGLQWLFPDKPVAKAHKPALVGSPSSGSTNVHVGCCLAVMVTAIAYFTLKLHTAQ